MKKPLHPALHPALYRCLIGLGLCVVLACSTGCDSNDPDVAEQTHFDVTYAVAGTCNGIISVGYTIDGGGSNGASIALPWSIDQIISAPASPTAVGLAVNCLGDGTVDNTITGRIEVEGDERDAKTATGRDLISLSVSALLR